MELASKLSVQIALHARPETEEQLLIVIDKLTKEKFLSQPLQTIIQQLRVAITVLTGYNDLFDVTTRKSINIFISVSKCFEYNVVRTPPATFDVEIQ